MAHRIAHCIALVATLLLLACGGADSQQALLLDEIAIQMNTAPDSALARLDSMNAETLPRHQRMRWELLRGNCLNKTYKKLPSDSAMQEVVKYFDEQGTANERLLAHYMLGCTYRDMGDAPQAIACYKDAIQQADTLSQDCDWATLMRVHSQLSDIYSQMHLADLEQKENRMAEEISWHMGDTQNALYFSKMECNILYREQRYEECISRAEEIIRRYHELGYHDDAYLSCIHGVKSYLAQKDYSRTKEYLEQYQRCSFFHDETKIRNVAGGRGPLYIYWSSYYLGTNRLDSAEIMLRQALTVPEERNNRLLIYRNMIELYTGMSQPDSLVKYTRLYSQEKETSYDETREQYAILVSSLYDYNTQQRLIEQEKKKSDRLRNRLYLSVTIITLLLMIVLVRRNIRKLKIEKFKSSYRSALRDVKLAEEQLRNLIAEKELLEKSHAQETLNFENLIAMKAREIEELKATIALQEKQFPDNENSRNQMILEESLIVRRFQKIWRHIAKETPTEEDWRELRQKVEEIYPCFYSKLNGNTPLATNEYRICLLVKAKFTPAAISALLGMSPSYSTQMRKNLFKKVFHIEGNARKFDKFIHSIT